MQTILNKIVSIIIAPVLLLGSLISPVQAPVTPVIEAPTQNVGAALPQATGVFETSLASPISSTATSMTLTSNSVRGGGSVSGYTCFTVDEGTAQAEVICGTVSSTAVTSMTRGISYADGITAVAANKFSHRRGANVKITDFPLVQILKAQNNGDETFPNPLKYDNGVGPVGSSDLTDKEYVLSVVSGGSVSTDKIVVTGIAGETITIGQLVYFKSSDSRWWKTDADTASTVENVILGIAQGAGSAGGSIASGVLIQGIDGSQTGLTANTVYYASNTAGGLSTSAGTKEVTVGVARSATEIIFVPRYNQNITENEQDALAGGGALGTPSSSNLYQTQEGVIAYSLAVTNPVIRVYSPTPTSRGDTSTRFDITDQGSSTFRYTWDGTGTNPAISAANFPVGIKVVIHNSSMNAGNIGAFLVTASNTNWFEITNASGVAENDKTLLNGYLNTIAAQTWTKPAGLKYIIAEVVGGGGGGERDPGGGGGGGGYSKEIIVVSDLGSTESMAIGHAGTGDIGGNSSNGGTSSFGTTPFLQATGGSAGTDMQGGSGGVGSNGILNIGGGAGSAPAGSDTGSGGTQNRSGGTGGSSVLGGGGKGAYPSGAAADAGKAYGGGGGGGADVGAIDGANGSQGVVIVTEYYY